MEQSDKKYIIMKTFDVACSLGLIGLSTYLIKKLMNEEEEHRENYLKQAAKIFKEKDVKSNN